jgi:hypothetical protein
MAADLLTERFSDQITGVLSCYDRLIVQGTVPDFCCAQTMTNYLYERRIRIFRLHAICAAAARGVA